MNSRKFYQRLKIESFVVADMFDEKNRIESCEVAVKLKKKVDDSLHFLVVFVAVFVNAMFQSMVPVFNGEKTAKFLTSFTQNLSSTRFDVSDGIRRRVIVELVLLIIFELLVVCLYFSPPGSSGNNFIQVGSLFTFNFIFQELFTKNTKSRSNVCYICLCYVVTSLSDRKPIG